MNEIINMAASHLYQLVKCLGAIKKDFPDFELRLTGGRVPSSFDQVDLECKKWNEQLDIVRTNQEFLDSFTEEQTAWILDNINNKYSPLAAMLKERNASPSHAQTE